MNLSREHTVLLSAHLSIDPAAGQVQAGAECIRLGPVNMKVLVLLLENGGRVVTRTEFFDRVWKQQLVSDDVLTRSISDLRTQLGKYTDAPLLIETIPKKGYRWVPSVETGPAEFPLKLSQVVPQVAPQVVQQQIVPQVVQQKVVQQQVVQQQIAPQMVPVPLPEPGRRTLPNGLRLLYWGAAVLAGLLLLSSLVLWVSGNYSASDRVRMAMLPLQVDAAAQQALATELEGLIQQQILDSEQFEILSFSATSVYLQNPFPGLAREYGVSYIIEGRIQTYRSQPRITLVLADARSASIVDSLVVDIEDASDLYALSVSFTGRFSQLLDER